MPVYRVRFRSNENSVFERFPQCSKSVLDRWNYWLNVAIFFAFTTGLRRETNEVRNANARTRIAICRLPKSRVLCRGFESNWLKSYTRLCIYYSSLSRHAECTVVNTTSKVPTNKILLLRNCSLRTIGLLVLHYVLGRLVAVVVPLDVDGRAGHCYHPQVVRSVGRLLHVQLHQLLVPAVHVTRLAHVRTAVVHLHVTDLQRSDDFFAERLLPFRKSESRGTETDHIILYYYHANLRGR